MNRLKTFFSGFAIGAGMSVPGISGGTMAIILGIYNKLLYSVGNILKEAKKSIPFLLLFCLGAAGGLLTAARLISFLLSTPAEVPLRFAFLGAAAGCIPPILREAKLAPVTPPKLLLLLLGMILAAMISFIPEGVFTAQSEGLGGVLIQAAGGLLVAAALVLPGISASQMLYMLGLYERVMERISAGELLALLPMTVGLAAGIFLTAKLLSALLERFDGAYLLILGFMLYSLKELIPQWSGAAELVIGLISAVIGFVLAFLIARRENSQNSPQDIVQDNG